MYIELQSRAHKGVHMRFKGKEMIERMHEDGMNENECESIMKLSYLCSLKMIATHVIVLQSKYVNSINENNATEQLARSASRFRITGLC